MRATKQGRHYQHKGNHRHIMREYHHYKGETHLYYRETVAATAYDDGAANRIGSVEAAGE